MRQYIWGNCRRKKYDVSEGAPVEKSCSCVCMRMRTKLVKLSNVCMPIGRMKRLRDHRHHHSKSHNGGSTFIGIRQRLWRTRSGRKLCFHSKLQPHIHSQKILTGHLKHLPHEHLFMIIAVTARREKRIIDFPCQQSRISSSIQIFPSGIHDCLRTLSNYRQHQYRALFESGSSMHVTNTVVDKHDGTDVSPRSYTRFVFCLQESDKNRTTTLTLSPESLSGKVLTQLLMWCETVLGVITPS